jgi:hypothetical protein
VNFSFWDYILSINKDKGGNIHAHCTEKNVVNEDGSMFKVFTNQ